MDKPTQGKMSSYLELNRKNVIVTKLRYVQCYFEC